ncbi:hypothetical protein ACWF94_16445 [Streptomyces sp. NPDC055078]
MASELIDPQDRPTGGVPDPYVSPMDYLKFRHLEFRQARRDLAEGFLFMTAEVIRKQWPTAHQVVFDCTVNNWHKAKPPRFLRVEDTEGTSLVAHDDTAPPRLSEEVEIALDLLLEADWHVDASSGAGSGRPWRIEKSDSTERGAQPPYNLTFTLPPVSRPADDRTALPPTSVTLRNGAFRVYDRDPAEGLFSDTYVAEVFGVNVVIRERPGHVLYMHVENEHRADEHMLFEADNRGEHRFRI